MAPIGVARSLLVTGIVAGVAIAAAVHGLRGGGAAPAGAAAPSAVQPELAGADVPPPGALPGSLTFLDGDCRLRELDFAGMTISGGAEVLPGCSLWLSPAGDHAVLASGPGGHRDARVYRLGVHGAPLSLGSFVGDPSWSPDGTRIAWCSSRLTTVLALPGEARERFPGCHPAFAPSGDLLSVAEADGEPQLLRNGVPLLDGEALRSGFPPAAGPPTVLGYDVRADGLLAVALVSGLRREPPPAATAGLASAGPFGASDARPAGAHRRFVLQLWRGHRLERAVSLRGLAYPFVNLAFGELVRFSPRGDELAVGASGVGVPVMLLDVETLEPRLRPTVQQGFSWSPDGAWFALVDAQGVRIAGAVRDSPAYVLPLEASSLEWR